MAAHLQDFSSPHSLFKRCVQCPPVAPSCPTCKADEVCTQTIGDCNSCASAICLAKAVSGQTPTTSNNSGSGPNIGAIVGGVIGGVIFIAIAVFCVWKFWLKGRRHEVEPEEEWDETDYPLEKPNASVFNRQASRASTHTVASMASTVLTRASNIIQIAYIPGVTNRTNSASPNLLVPPVPPIPIPTTPSTLSQSSHFEDEHFFVPGDLRDSTYSDMSSIDGRRPGSIASSLARNSVATTVYRDSAVLNPMPAQQIISGKAAVVSVKSGPSQTSSPALPPGTPPVPHIDSQRQGSSNRPVVFKMLGSDGPKSSPGGSVISMKPVALNIVKAKGSSSALSGTSTAVDSNDSTPEKNRHSLSTPTAEARGLGLRPLTQTSIAESTETTDSPGRRARRSRVMRTSSHTQEEGESSDDEVDTHARSRRSLLAVGLGKQEKGRSPFSDDAEAPKTPTTPTIKISKAFDKPQGDRNKSPFEDENAV